jgi:hypothetical protein
MVTAKKTTPPKSDVDGGEGGEAAGPGPRQAGRATTAARYGYGRDAVHTHGRTPHDMMKARGRGAEEQGSETDERSTASRCIDGGTGGRWHCTFIAIPPSDSLLLYPHNCRLGSALVRPPSPFSFPAERIIHWPGRMVQTTTASDGTVHLERLVLYYFRFCEYFT